MRGPRIAHRLRQFIGQSARVAEHDPREQGGPLGRQSPPVRRLGGQSRALGPCPVQETRGRRGGRHRHLASVKHPRTARGLKRACLVEISGIARPSRRPQLSLDDRRATLFQIVDPDAARQPDERALNSRRRGESQPRTPAPARLANRSVEYARDAHRPRSRHLPPAVIAGRRQRSSTARDQSG